MGLPVAAPVAALGRRSAAYIADSLVIGLAYIALGVMFDSIFGPLVAATPDGLSLMVVAVNPLRVALELSATLVVDALYFAGCWCRWGATPAQRALGLRVRLQGSVASATESAASARGLPAEAAGRRWALLAILPIALGSLSASGAMDVSLVAVVNGAWFLILLVSAAVDPLRRGLHDRVAGTIVVSVSSRPA
jgi:uncharacterized RDD family membrane protein YckC